MKRYIIIFSMIIASCNFLEEEPKDFLSPANFYQTSGDAEAAVNAAYNYLASGNYYGQNIWQLGDVTTDILEAGQGSRDERVELDEYLFNTNNSAFAEYWQTIYTAINTANTGINRIPAIDMNESLKSRLIAELKFLRALFYFDLTKVFGNVPLITEETTDLTNLNVGNVPQAEIYQQIINDLEEASANLPESYSSSEVGRATEGAALSLLGKVYLYTEDYDNAAQTLTQVTQLNYDLLDNFAEVWDPANENSEEHIFSVQYKAGIRGSGFNEIFNIRGAPTPLTGFSGGVVSQNFADSFDPADLRKDASIVESYTFPDGVTRDFDPHVFKYFNPNGPSPGDTDTNWPVIRYADVLLMLAEAINEENGGPNQAAYEAINTVRNRAGLADLPMGLTQEEFRNAIFEERKFELAFEGHRWFDLKRSGQLESVIENLGYDFQPKHQFFPIPQRELDVNTLLEQNTGY